MADSLGLSLKNKTKHKETQQNKKNHHNEKPKPANLLSHPPVLTGYGFPSCEPRLPARRAAALGGEAGRPAGHAQPRPHTPPLGQAGRAQPSTARGPSRTGAGEDALHTKGANAPWPSAFHATKLNSRVAQKTAPSLSGPRPAGSSREITATPGIHFAAGAKGGGSEGR